MNDNKTEQTTHSVPRLSLRKERIRVLGVRTSVKTGVPMCPFSCFFVTRIIPPTTTKTA